MTKLLILGIDPGLVQTGWGIVSAVAGKVFYCASGVISNPPQAQQAQRLLVIDRALSQVMLDHMPMCAAIENTYVNNNAASSLKLAQARAVAMVAMARAGLEVSEYQAKTIKKTLVGNGAAAKEQIQAMLKYMMLGVNIRNHNEADALAVAICHANHITSSYGRVFQ